MLGEFVLPDGRPVWTAALIDLLAALDVAEKAARQAIMRTADSGWIEASRVGRETRWSLTPAGTRLLREGTARIYGFAADERPWDGRWLLRRSASRRTTGRCGSGCAPGSAGPGWGRSTPRRG